MSAEPRHAWFAAKTQGYGAGWPIAWQGWAVLAIFIGVAVTSAAILPRGPQLVVVVLGTVGAVIVAKRTTVGGWRWRGD